MKVYGQTVRVVAGKKRPLITDLGEAETLPESVKVGAAYLRTQGKMGRSGEVKIFGVEGDLLQHIKMAEPTPLEIGFDDLDYLETGLLT